MADLKFNPTNLARLCTAKWQPIYAAVDKWWPKPVMCQVFMSPVYEWGEFGHGKVYYYDNAWHDASKLQTVYIYDWNKRREYNDKTDWRAMQYSNKKVVMLPEPPLPTNYTVTIAVSPEWAGSVDTSKVTVAEWTLISAEWNILSIGENVEVTATAEEWYVFSSWWELPEAVTEDLTITATFEAETPA